MACICGRSAPDPRNSIGTINGMARLVLMGVLPFGSQQA